MKETRRGVMYKKRVKDVNRIYAEKSRLGLSNREIWRRHIYPLYGMTERTFYNIIGAGLNPSVNIPDDMLSLFPEYEEDNEQQQK